MSKFSVVLEGTCKCTLAPMGDHGLEGYDKNETYRYQLMLDEPNNKEYYRVYPTLDFPDYYETCAKHHFKKYFAVE